MVAVDPTVTLPKLMVDGLNARLPAFRPIPESATLKVGAFEVTVSFPLRILLVVGRNWTVNVTLLPAARLTGVVRLVTLKAPVTVVFETVTVPVPLLVKVMDLETVVFTGAFPNRRLLAEELKVAPKLLNGVINATMIAIENSWGRGSNLVTVRMPSIL